MRVDLRSDTVTKPTAAMRRAMADAEVGDDGYGDDLTVRRLEELFAARVGKEAAVFVPSGTMGNQIALRLLGRPGTSIAIGRRRLFPAVESNPSAIVVAPGISCRQQVEQATGRRPLHPAEALAKAL